MGNPRYPTLDVEITAALKAACIVGFLIITRKIYVTTMKKPMIEAEKQIMYFQFQILSNVTEPKERRSEAGAAIYLTKR